MNLLAAEGGNGESTFWGKKRKEIYLFEFILFLFLLVAMTAIRFTLMISDWKENSFGKRKIY